MNNDWLLWLWHGVVSGLATVDIVFLTLKYKIRLSCRFRNTTAAYIQNRLFLLVCFAYFFFFRQIKLSKKSEYNVIDCGVCG